MLAEITWDARASVEDVARRLGLRSHLVRSAISRLAEMVEYLPLCWTNPYLLGDTPNRVFLSLDCSKAKRRAALLKRLEELPQVTWMTGLMGRYQLGLAVRAGGQKELHDLFLELDRDFGDIVLERHISAILQLSQFVPWLAHIGPGRRRCWQYQVARPHPGIDEVDRRLLDILRQDPLASVAAVGKAAGVPASTVGYRLGQLQSSGVIIGFALSYDERRIGGEGFVLSVATNGLGGSGFDDFFSLAQRHANVCWIARMLGKWEVELGVVVYDVDELDMLMRDLYEAGQGSVRDVSVHSIGRVYKDKE